jgi:hypothetical protein
VSLTLLTTKKVDFIVEYLREYEAICKQALTHLSGAQMELFDEKNQRSIISWQGSLKRTKLRTWKAVKIMLAFSLHGPTVDTDSAGRVKLIFLKYSFKIANPRTLEPNCH